ncbi:hypothetical protein OHA37_39775 (plasmid) [Streptomyces sp. NBC_00335]|uniref:hypothetical protein n=1 Tax=unclassified Streptomyces TaxID=2593676 RepID=UPI00225BA4C3|nr:MULTISPECIES: hypothetical protein [unclassified Streptomyces]MCX5409966.1 hypothetical protein [Streptomyces sp. NBC_00086]
MIRPGVRYARARAIRRAHGEADTTVRVPLAAPLPQPGAARARAAFPARAGNAVAVPVLLGTAVPARAGAPLRAWVPGPARALVPAESPEQEGPS